MVVHGETGKKQIPSDRVIKFQGVEIIGLIFPLIRGQNVVETSRRYRKSRLELLSPAEGHPFTTKSGYSRDCSESTGLPAEDVYRTVRVRTFEPGGPHDGRSRCV